LAPLAIFFFRDEFAADSPLQQGVTCEPNVRRRCCRPAMRITALAARSPPTLLSSIRSSEKSTRIAIAMPRRSSVCLPALICSSRPSTLQGRVCELSVPGRPRGRHLGDRPKAGDRAPVKWTWRSLEIEIRQRDVPGPSVEEPRDRRRRRTSVWRQAAVARCLSRQLGGGRHPPRLGRQPVGADPMVGNPRAPRAADRELN
jgi:hypothetical protein